MNVSFESKLHSITGAGLGSSAWAWLQLKRSPMLELRWLSLGMRAKFARGTTMKNKSALSAVRRVARLIALLSFLSGFALPAASNAAEGQCLGRTLPARRGSRSETLASLATMQTFRQGSQVPKWLSPSSTFGSHLNSIPQVHRRRTSRPSTNWML